MHDHLTIENIAERLGLTYAEGHHHVLHMGKMQTDELQRWKRVAKFLLDYLRPQNDKYNKVVFTPPLTPQTREQMSMWIARHWLGRSEISPEYWRNTRKPYMRVADKALTMDLQ